MNSLKAASVFFLIMISVSGYSALAAAPTDASIVGARQGDWAMYVGAPPSEEYEWIRISVLQVNGSAVDLELHYDLRTRFRLQSSVYYPDHPRFVNIDVGDGTSNFFFFLIPRNLTVGDAVPVWRDHVPLRIEGVEQREYAGAVRTVVYASFSNMTVSYADFKTAGRYYWDKETGLLVERVATLGNADVTSEILTGTSLWSIDLRYWLGDNYPVVVMLVGVIGAMAVSAVVLFRLRKKIPNRVTHPNIGLSFLVVGAALVAVGIVNLSYFEQLVSSLCFGFAPFFIVSGVLAYTGAWVTLRKDRLQIDMGIVLIAAALILGGIVISCLTYRELMAIVPYLEDTIPGGTGGSMQGRSPVTYTSLDGVLFYPYVWLSSAVTNVIICLGVVGLFYKISNRF